MQAAHQLAPRALLERAALGVDGHVNGALPAPSNSISANSAPSGRDLQHEGDAGEHQRAGRLHATACAETRHQRAGGEQAQHGAAGAGGKDQRGSARRARSAP